MNGITWRDFVDSIHEVDGYKQKNKRKEPTPFKSKAQKRYKAQRKRNDIYSTISGHKNLNSGAPFNNKTRRAGTDRLRFEENVEASSFDTNENLEPQKQNHPSRLQPSVDLITEDYEPALCIVLFVDEAGGSPR